MTHRDHGIPTHPSTSLSSFKCLSLRYLEALKEKTAGSLAKSLFFQPGVFFRKSSPKILPVIDLSIIKTFSTKPKVECLTDKLRFGAVGFLREYVEKFSLIRGDVSIETFIL